MEDHIMGDSSYRVNEQESYHLSNFNYMQGKRFPVPSALYLHHLLRHGMREQNNCNPEFELILLSSCSLAR